jgi:hypothetical protein
LTRDVLRICAALLEKKPLAAILVPLALAIPAVTLLNYWMEDAFARQWGSEWERLRGLEAGTSTRGMWAASGEATA